MHAQFGCPKLLSGGSPLPMCPTMKWLIIAALLLSQQSAKAPQVQGTAKRKDSNSARPSKSPYTAQRATTLSSSTGADASIIPNGKKAPRADDPRTSADEQPTGGEDRTTQRKLVWFT